MTDAAEQAIEDPRTYFAEERTFLAWIRTGLGLMGVGFAVARFGLFLRQLQATEMARTAAASAVPVHGTGYSVYAGVGLVALGVLVNLAAVRRHLRTVSQLRTGTWTPTVNRSAIGLAAVLALVGVAMATYLLLLR